MSLNFNPIIVLFLTALAEFWRVDNKQFQSYYSLIFNKGSGDTIVFIVGFQSYYSLIFNKTNRYVTIIFLNFNPIIVLFLTPR